MMTYCNTDPDCPAEIRESLARIEAAAGEYAVSHSSPCGLVAYYDEGETAPWRIADDWASERFATPDAAEDAASEWAEAVQ
jgi:hypothetical protein